MYINLFKGFCSQSWRNIFNIASFILLPNSLHRTVSYLPKAQLDETWQGLKEATSIKPTHKVWWVVGRALTSPLEERPLASRITISRIPSPEDCVTFVENYLKYVSCALFLAYVHPINASLPKKRQVATRECSGISLEWKSMRESE